MKAKTLAGLLGILLVAVFIITPSALAYHPHYGGWYFGDEYDNDWDVDRDYFYGDYGDYGDYGYSRPPYYDSYRYDDYDYDDYYGYDHPSGLFGYWGKDADHHRRGHRHHHLF